MTDVSSSKRPSPDIEFLRLDLERHKANLDFRRAVIISGFVAVAIALIPPGFQLATAAIDYVKFRYQLELDAANKKADREREALAFQATYIGNFLDKALNQEIEVRLRLAEYFKHLAQGDIKNGWEKYYNALNDRRSDVQNEIEKMEEQYGSLGKTSRDVVQAERLFERLSWKRNEVGYVPLGKSVSKGVSSSSSTELTVILYDSPVIPGGRRVFAEKIVSAFANAGFGPAHQVAGLADAIADSGLNPNARLVSEFEESYGLFQLNRKGGLGTGMSPEQLTDPDTNIALVIAAAKKSSRFVTATNVPEAVSAFAATISRPANQREAIARRLAIAQQLLPGPNP